MPRAVVITYGCQMNEADSAEIKRLLLEKGFDVSGEATNCDLILLNTCSVRRRAEMKVFGKLGHLKALKRERPDLTIGVLGCMGASSREEIERQAPFVDFVLPPHQFEALSEMLDQRFPREGSILKEADGTAGIDLEPNDCPFKAFVNISRGCSNRCSFCIVPLVRGPQTCLPYEKIRAAVASCERRGVVEVCLLGQNVNAYHLDGREFADILEGLAREIPRIRFRFTSPHPKDFSERVVDVIAGWPNIARHVHLPLQSGSDRILKSMNRGYDVRRFTSLVDLLRRRIPDVALTTDLICGFPGETEIDFQETLRVVREVGFDQAFTFYYSPRQGTAAATYPDQLPESVRKERLRRLIDTQLSLSRERAQALVGRTFEVLVERVARRPVGGLVGRTGSNRLVIFSGSANLVGSHQLVKIVSGDSVTLFGDLVEA